MASFNQVTLLGNVGKDPQIITTQNGKKIAHLTIVTQERGYTKKDGSKIEAKTDWHKVSFFGGVVGIVEKYVKKGSQVLVQGKLRNSSYEKDGVKHYTIEIIAEDLLMLGGKPDTTSNDVPVDDRPNIENPTNGWSPQTQATVNMFKDKFDAETVDDSQLPF